MRDDPKKPAFIGEVLDPRARPAVMSLKEAESQLREAVMAADLGRAESAASGVLYEATELLERLEPGGLVRGNGHHMRQKVAEQVGPMFADLRVRMADAAVAMLRERWTGPNPDN